MERRVLLAISLSFVVLFLYQTFLVPPPTEAPAPASATSSPPALPADGSTPSAAPFATGGQSSPQPAVGAADVVAGEQSERLVVLENRVVRATFTNRGGRLQSWELKEYTTAAGEPVDLIPDAVAAQPVLPFSLLLDDGALSDRLNTALFRAEMQPAAGADGGSSTVSFTLALADGTTAEKRFTLDPGSYLVDVHVQLQRSGEPLTPALAWGPGLGDEIAQSPPGSFFSPNYSYPAQAIFSRDGSVERLTAESLGSGTVQDGQFEFAGIDDQYFVAAVVTPGVMRLQYTPFTLPAPTPPTVGRYVGWSVRRAQSAEPVRFFVGPKQFDVLRAVHPDFTRVIYFGIFAWLAVPLLGALQWVNGYIGNYGWSIIVLTILINLAMWPLRHKSVVSMRRMQELQPQMKAIQDRYAKYKITDPERQKMNQEVMELYRSKNVNPASGCVPMLLTLPFLFAFYAMLSQAIEIRGARFMGWITDLSSHDPLYITPLLMGVTMFWQQKMTPSTADPTQQRILMVMPLLFTFMFLWAPSGLVLYWLVSNLWGIGQQYATNYLIGPPKPHNVRPSDDREPQRPSARGARAAKPTAGKA